MSGDGPVGFQGIALVWHPRWMTQILPTADPAFQTFVEVVAPQSPPQNCPSWRLAKR